MYDYAAVHAVYTIPVATVLTVVAKPLLTKRDLYKIGFLITIAVVYTIPWDSYLIRTGVWSYPPEAIIGPTLFSIPAEELFFFVIQTYITTLLQILFSKPVLFAAYLQNDTAPGAHDLRLRHHVGQGVLLASIVLSLLPDFQGKEGTYMKLILLWASPVLLFLWSLSYPLLLALPRSKTNRMRRPASGVSKLEPGWVGLCSTSTSREMLRQTHVLVAATFPASGSRKGPSPELQTLRSRNYANASWIQHSRYTPMNGTPLSRCLVMQETAFEWQLRVTWKLVEYSSHASNEACHWTLQVAVKRAEPVFQG